MTRQTIEAQVIEEGERVSGSAASAVMATQGKGSIRTTDDLAELLDVLAKSTWMLGLEHGLAVGVTDVAGARLILEWLQRDVQADDVDAIEETVRTVARLLGAAER